MFDERRSLCSLDTIESLLGLLIRYRHHLRCFVKVNQVDEVPRPSLPRNNYMAETELLRHLMGNIFLTLRHLRWVVNPFTETNGCFKRNVYIEKISFQIPRRTKRRHHKTLTIQRSKKKRQEFVENRFLSSLTFISFVSSADPRPFFQVS